MQQYIILGYTTSNTAIRLRPVYKSPSILEQKHAAFIAKKKPNSKFVCIVVAFLKLLEKYGLKVKLMLKLVKVLETKSNYIAKKVLWDRCKTLNGMCVANELVHTKAARS